MKKLSLILTFILFTGALFARDYSFMAVETDNNSVTECYGESVSTIKTEDNIEISVSMDRCQNGNNFRVCVDIKNLGDKDFHFDDDCIKAYYGNFDENEWERMEYLPAREFYEEAQHDATVRTVLASIALGLAAIDSGLAPDPFDFPIIPPPIIPGPIPVGGGHGTRLYKASRSSHHDGDPVWVGLGLMNLFGTIDENESTLDFLADHLLYSETIGPDEGYSGLFYLPSEKGPDYKITMRLSKTETIEFYFSRTDREKVLHPWMDTDDNQFALLFSVGSSNAFIPHIGCDFGFFNAHTGGYFGYGFGYQESYHYERFEGMLDFGVTEKLCPHLWIMGGAGMSVACETIEDNWGYEKDQYYFSAGPEVGLNVIFGGFDFGGKVRYKIFGPVEFEIMAGFAF